MRRTVILLILAVGLASNANAAIIIDNSIAGSITNDFEALATGSVAGFISQTGATYGERFAGQTLSTGTGFDVLSGTPTNSLTLLSNAVVADNIGILLSGSLVAYGDLSGAVGEGALSIYLDLPTDVLGFDVVGVDGGGALFVQFFGIDGSVLGAISQAPANAFFGFRATTGEQIRGISITNTDPAGIGYDNFTFNAIPEPSTALLLASGLVGLAAHGRRRKA